jgi:3-keto-disaccharide hydrolase
MNRNIILLGICAFVLSATLVGTAETAIEPKEKIMLFDGKSFDGLVRHLRNNQGNVNETWQIKPDGVLACSGRPAGYIRTDKSYKNYKIHVEYRWPGRTGNNGILVHMTGEDKVWPKSLECQGMFHNQGDYYEIGGVEFNEHKIGGHRVRGRRVIKYGAHNEKEAGQWNVYEVFCVGGIVRPYVNGKLMNEASECSITEGKICLQSEGVPIEFRNIYLEPAKKLPWPVTPKKKTLLFNGKDLDGWIRFSPKDKADKDKKWTVDKVWSVKDGVIRCEGKPNGYIKTVDSYANYKLHLEWRWPDKPTNSGVLLHCEGIDKTWPKCVEAQLMHENAGDFWLLSFSSIKVDGKQIGPEQYANGKKKHPSNEKPVGQWNSYDIVCDGKTVSLSVNGLLQNQGTDAKPAFGPICLQSEGSPIEFRNIYLEPVK